MDAEAVGTAARAKKLMLQLRLTSEAWYHETLGASVAPPLKLPDRSYEWWEAVPGRIDLAPAPSGHYAQITSMGNTECQKFSF